MVTIANCHKFVKIFSRKIKHLFTKLIDNDTIEVKYIHRMG